MIAIMENETIRHKKCARLYVSRSRRCNVCNGYRKKLFIMASRNEQSTSSKMAADTHANYRYLSSPEKVARMKELHKSKRKTKQQLDRISSRLQLLITTKGVEVDNDTNSDLLGLLKEGYCKIESKYDDNSFHKLFWKQQMKAASLKKARSMKWHPLMIKWCLYLRHLSGRSYELLRDSGCVILPSQRTLRDYTYYVRASTGFSVEVDRQLMSAAKIEEGMEEWKKCVVLVMDEMYIKEDLVYNKHSGALIGFANLGDTNEHLLKFQHLVEGDDSQCDDQQLAKTMFVFMVRGIFSNNLQFPYVQFPCANVTGELLFDPFWEAVCRLERMGLKVLAATADGASTNRRLIKLHTPGREVSYRVINPHAPEKRFLYFISDPPHLIKTVRNAWANPKRNLWVSCNRIVIDI